MAITTADYLKRILDNSGKTMRESSTKIKRSPGYWWSRLRDHYPPNLENVKLFIKEFGLDEEQKKVALNLLFKDRLLYFLEKEGFLPRHPTSEIRTLIKSLQKWHPEDGQEIGYIMLTLAKIYGPEIALKISQLGGKGLNVNEHCLIGEEETLSLKEGFPAEPDGCSRDFGDLGI